MKSYLEKLIYIIVIAVPFTAVVVWGPILYEKTHAVITSGKDSQKKFLTIGTGGVTGVYYPTGGAICRLINRNRDDHGIQCSVESTGGSVYNLNALLNGELDIGIAQTDLQHHAYHETGLVSSLAPNPELRSVVDLYIEPLTVLANRNAQISTVYDLKGKKINIGVPGSGQRETVSSLVKNMGWTFKDFSLISELNPVEQSGALCDGKVDAIVFSAGHPNGSIQEATATCPTHIIPLEGPEIEAMCSKFPYYIPASIPGKIYRGTPDAQPTFGTKVSVVTTSNVSSDIIYLVTKAIVEHFDAFKKVHPAFANLNVEDLVGNPDILPIHEGALKYFEEHGIEGTHQKALSNLTTPNLDSGL